MKAVNRIFVFLVLGSWLLASCAPAATATSAPVATQVKPTDANPTAAPAGNKPTLTMWFDSGGDATTMACMIDQLVGNFNAKGNTFTVEAQALANSWDATRVAVTGGGGPDIVGTPGPSFAYLMAKAGQLLALDGFAQDMGWDKQFLPWALELGKVDGKLYSIPHEIETMVLYYNKTVFAAHGWQPPKTIAEYLKLSADIKAAGLIPNGGGNAEWKPNDEHYFTIFVNHMAGPQKVYDALTGKTPWTDPDILKAVDTMNQLFINGDFMGGLDRYYTTMSADFLAAFGAGKVAMMPSGSWWMGGISQYFGDKAGNTNDWDWVSFPTSDGTPLFTLGIGSTYSINAATKYPKEAAQFLTYWFSPEAQSVSISDCGLAPAPITLAADQLKNVDPRRARLIEELSKAAGAGNYGYTTWTFWPPKSNAYIYDEIEKVWAGQTTSQDYLKGLDTLFQEELKAGDIPPIPPRN